ncbi:MAG: phenylalanine--tRNA ligase subunit beta [Nanoarchaeota archaeon]|nr:phenylalanine--tRNA ligase subunit beta [Nanoarchaeota archaeon]
MVYVYSKKTQLDKYLKEELTTEEVKETLMDLGMDLKGEKKLEDNEVELKIEITAEKMDMISTCGIARAINYHRGYLKELPNYELKKGNLEVHVKESANKVRPKTVAAILRNAPMSQELLDELIEIQEKIHDSFGRHRKKAAIGIYPMDSISFPISFLAEKPDNISFHPLEAEGIMNATEILEHHETGKKFSHLLDGKEVFPIFKDAKGEILSMPPIINSHKTGRVETHHRDLFVEVSGHNLNHLDNILKVLITTCIELGCEAESLKVHYPDKSIYELSLDSTTDTISLDYVNSLIGIDVLEDDVKSLLPKVQYGCKAIKDGEIIVEVPAYKSDVFSDSDIADDIARAYGYNNIIPKIPSVDSIGEELHETVFRNNIREQLVSLGFLELYTYMLTSTNQQYDLMNIKAHNHVKIIDSAEEGINMTRTWILPENLKSLTINRKNKYPQKVFECGFTIQKDLEKDTKARNELHLSVSIAGPDSNFTKIKEVLDTLSLLNSWNLELKESTHPSFIEGRQAQLISGGQEIGFIGELHPRVLENNNLIVPISSIELNLDKFYH